MKHTVHAIRSVWIVGMAAICLLSGTVLCAAEPEQGAMFSQQPKDNPKQIAGHEYPATVIIGKEFGKTRRVKIAVAPHKAPDSCWIQAAIFVGSGRQTRTVYVGPDKPTQEKYTLLLLKYLKGKDVLKEGMVLIDNLEKEGFEAVDSIEVERTE